MKDRIYLDNQSTTAVDPRVRAAMEPFLRDRYGHPASRSHPYGWDAERGLESARAQVADLIGAEPREIVFTSGGTEADNLAVKGVAEALEPKGRHVITTGVENRPVLDACAWLQRRGWEITCLAPDAGGRIDASAVEAAIRDDTVLISVQYANHEVGTVQPVAEIGEIAASRGVLLHSDATQAAAWLPLHVRDEGVHLLSLSANKMFGPKGVGALYIRRRKPRARVAPQIHGGGHERGFRAGLPDIAGAVGFGLAAELCRTESKSDTERVGALRDVLEGALLDETGATVMGSREHRLPNCTNLAFEGVEGEALLVALPEIALATGSACTSATAQPSYVLPAMGVDKSTAASSVRFSLGRFTQPEEIDRTVVRVKDVVARTRALDPRR